MTTMNKLVRDKIPEIIIASGRQVITETLTDERYRELLDEKLSEELLEYQTDKDVEELVDLLEVIYAIASSKGFSEEQLNNLRMNKAAERGGFEKKIYLRNIVD